MINAWINDGDTVIIKKTSTADSGKIVVALLTIMKHLKDLKKN